MPARPKIKTLRSGVRMFDGRAVKPEAKAADPFYLTPGYREWREKVVAKAGRRCEVIERGIRCRKAEPQHRMFADHIKEVRDEGARYDVANGQCLCGSHHTFKTTAARAARLADRSG